MKRQCLAVGIILLFIGVAVAPSINAGDDLIVRKTISNPKKEVTIMVLESKADGTSKKSTVILSHEQYLQLKEELNAIQDLDGRFAVYQKYGLIPRDVTVEKLRVGMEKRAKQLEISKEQQTLLPMRGKHLVVMKFFCFVYIYARFIFFPLRKYLTGFVPIPLINFLVWYEMVNELKFNDVVYNYNNLDTAQLIGFVGFTYMVVAPGAYFNGFEALGFSVCCLGEKLLPFTPI